MRLEQALEEYGKKRKQAEEDAEKVRRKYEKRLEKRLKGILKKIDELERKKIPRNIDDRIVKIVTVERKNYITSLRNALAGIDSMETLGKRLPDLAKLHVGHGKYLLLVFEREIYAINRLLKELNEDYVEYLRHLEELRIPELGLEETLEERAKVEKDILRIENEIEELKRRLKKSREELEILKDELGIKGLEDEIKALSSRIKSEEMEIRSKASKLQKPLKRMRLGGFANEFARDSSLALEKPKETLSLLQNIYPRFEGKYRKTARWLIENLEDKAEIVKRDRDRLKELKGELDRKVEKISVKETEIKELERLIEEKEAELRRLRNRLEHLEKQLNESMEKLETILGKRIER